MPIQFKPGPFDTIVDGPEHISTKTEQEHIDSCDINKMMKGALRGAQIRGSTSEPIYGEDDTTLDAIQFRIQKQKLEQELARSARENELTHEEAQHVPEHIKQKFGFKIKPKTKVTTKNDDLNDKNSDQNTSHKPDVKKSDSTSSQTS